MRASRLEGIAAAQQLHLGLFRQTGRAYGAEQPRTNQYEQVFLPSGQRRQIHVGNLHRRDDGVVVGYFAAVHYLGRVGLQFQRSQRQVANAKGNHRCGSIAHIIRQVPAVRAGIGDELCFVEALGVVQRLLGRVPVDAVGVPLQRRQVVQLGRLFAFLLLSPAEPFGGLAGAGRLQGFRRCFLIHTPAFCGQPLPV